MEVKQLAAEQLAAAEAQVQDDQQVSPWVRKSGFYALNPWPSHSVGHLTPYVLRRAWEQRRTFSGCIS